MRSVINIGGRLRLTSTKLPWDIVSKPVLRKDKMKEENGSYSPFYTKRSPPLVGISDKWTTNALHMSLICIDTE